MSTLAITGWGVLSPLGTGADEFTAAWRDRHSGLRSVEGMYEDPLPSDKACAITDFSVREHLGRKGTSFFDRSTSLAVVSCGLALADSDLDLPDEERGELGLILGLTNGGPQAMSEFIREMYINDKPYLVNPLLFPYAVMNGAASATAIWHQLRGVNATLSGGQMAFHTVLRYARNKIRNGYVRAAMAGVVEEFSPHRAWASHHTRGASDTPRVPLGEGGAFFTVESAEAVRAEGRHLDGEILAVETGLYGGDGDDPAEGLAELITRALEIAGAAPSDIRRVAPSLAGSSRRDAIERAGLAQAGIGGASVELLPVKELLGETYSASGGLQLAALLAEHRAEPALDGQLSLLTSVTSEGLVGAAVVRGWSRAGDDHRI
ncbi:beta-ketoacyl synthase N-terminal-like domain-containing protein [Kitasatospora sp. P5_F3]